MLFRRMTVRRLQTDHVLRLPSPESRVHTRVPRVLMGREEQDSVRVTNVAVLQDRSIHGVYRSQHISLLMQSLQPRLVEFYGHSPDIAVTKRRITRLAMMFSDGLTTRQRYCFIESDPTSCQSHHIGYVRYIDIRLLKVKFMLHGAIHFSIPGVSRLSSVADVGWRTSSVCLSVCP